MNVIQLAIAEIFRLKDVPVEHKHNAGWTTPAESQLLSGMRV